MCVCRCVSESYTLCNRLILTTFNSICMIEIGRRGFMLRFATVGINVPAYGMFLKIPDAIDSYNGKPFPVNLFEFKDVFNFRKWNVVAEWIHYLNSQAKPPGII